MPVAVYRFAKGIMLRPIRVHAEGCLHSDKPEMAVSRGSNAGEEVTSRFAKELYFKRCDGTFKNAAAGRLRMSEHRTVN